MTCDAERKEYQLFAQLLEYPTDSYLALVERGAAALHTLHPEAGELVDNFWRQVRQITLAQLAELYTQTFDLQGICCLYIGHHLFGETYKRSWFMARLNQEYRSTGFTAGNELPDHVTEILRFLSLEPQDEFSQCLVYEGMLPALEKMVLECSQSESNPYRLVIQSILQVLREHFPLIIDQPELSTVGGMDHD